MAIKMLVFDFRESEREFFRTHDLDNFEISFYPESLNMETISKIAPQDLDSAYVISVFVDSEVTEEVINSFKNLRIISTRSTGVDHINKKACDAKNISVVNVESYGSRSVAQYTIGLILALVRQIVPASSYIEKRDKSCEEFVGRDMSKLTLGVIGTGSIGVAVCKIAHALGMKILAYDKIERQELLATIGVHYVDFNTLLIESDIVSIHVPYSEETLNLFSAEQFSIMKNTSFLINVSRGEIVNIKDLHNAIIKGAIKGAALDVVTCEQSTFKCNQLTQNLNQSFECIEEAKLVQELVKLPNVIITPHIAYQTQDSIDFILQMTFVGILDCVKGGTTYRVN